MSDRLLLSRGEQEALRERAFPEQRGSFSQEGHWEATRKAAAPSLDSGQRKRWTAHLPVNTTFFQSSCSWRQELFISVLGVFLTKPKMFSSDINTSYLRPVTGFPVNGAHGDHTAAQPAPASPSLSPHSGTGRVLCDRKGVEGPGSGLPGPVYGRSGLLGGCPVLRRQVPASFWRYLHAAHGSRFPLM